jgi:hypothetical protein
MSVQAFGVFITSGVILRVLGALDYFFYFLGKDFVLKIYLNISAVF